jgi:selenoprotein W-related protein
LSPADERADVTAVEVEYCVPCGHLARAQQVQEALLRQFGRDLEAVSLVTGDGGVFVVRVGDEPVFDLSEDDYDVDEIVRRVEPHVGVRS